MKENEIFSIHHNDYDAPDEEEFPLDPDDSKCYNSIILSKDGTVKFNSLQNEDYLSIPYSSNKNRLQKDISTVLNYLEENGYNIFDIPKYQRILVKNNAEDKYGIGVIV